LIAEGSACILTSLADLTRLPNLCHLSRLGTVALLLILLASPAQSLARLVILWPRADSDRAANYVLTHRRPWEGIAANHWESVYYFRRLGPTFTYLEGAPRVLPEQLWLVSTAASWSDRRAIMERLAQEGWHPQFQRDFARTTVFFLRKQPPQPSQAR
jgi:hypothetical protein